MTMMCVVLIGIMAVVCAVSAVPAYAAGSRGSAGMLWPNLGSLACAVRVAVKILALLLKAIGVWAIIIGVVWYAIVRHGDYGATAPQYAKLTAIIGSFALLVGTAMLVLDAPGSAYMAVLHMLW